MVAALSALLLLAVGQVADQLFDPVQGYRLGHYRGVVPVAPEGVAKATKEQVAIWWRSRSAILIDVTPAEGSVRDPASGQWKIAEPHWSIPGAHWFPESGRGILADGIGSWFLEGIARLHRARPSAPIVVYCLADCWMSWNAALRLHRAGYRDVRWYADGLDGWRELRLPTANAFPER